MYMSRPTTIWFYHTRLNEVAGSKPQTSSRCKNEMHRGTIYYESSSLEVFEDID